VVYRYFTSTFLNISDASDWIEEFVDLHVLSVVVLFLDNCALSVPVFPMLQVFLRMLIWKLLKVENWRRLHLSTRSLCRSLGQSDSKIVH
jgi:hypothetical protein